MQYSSRQGSIKAHLLNDNIMWFKTHLYLFSTECKTEQIKMYSPINFLVPVSKIYYHICNSIIRVCLNSSQSFLKLSWQQLLLKPNINCEIWRLTPRKVIQSTISLSVTSSTCATRVSYFLLALLYQFAYCCVRTPCRLLVCTQNTEALSSNSIKDY